MKISKLICNIFHFIYCVFNIDKHIFLCIEVVVFDIKLQKTTTFIHVFVKGFCFYRCDCNFIQRNINDTVNVVVLRKFSLIPRYSNQN